MMRFLIIALVCIGLVAINARAHSTATQQQGKSKVFNEDCTKVEGFTQELRQEIQSKSGDVKRIMDLVLNGPERHSTYNELSLFCDTFGPRLSGSDSLAQSIDYMMKKMKQDGELDVRAEKVLIPKWEVKKQWAEMVEPVQHPMFILALGTSVGTNNQTFEAEVVMVHSFDELDRKGDQGLLTGKIVVFNYNFTVYGESVKFRTNGALRASKYGAAAALIRSVTPFSIYSPHTGMGSRSIPTVAITVEDANLIERWLNRNKKVVIKLFIDAKNYDDVESHNVIGDIKGSSKPEEVIVVSGHIDTWYNTQGAMDDGGGMMISYKALDILSKLNLRPKRTVRAILWTSEEFGLIGAQQYFKDHKHELKNFKVVMESDLGTFTPKGLSHKNFSPLGRCIVKEVLNLTAAIGTTQLDSNYEGSDVEVFSDVGVPGLSLANDNANYFYYHHSSADTISLENPDDLDKSTILWAVASYVLADLSVDIR